MQIVAQQQRANMHTYKAEHSPGTETLCCQAHVSGIESGRVISSQQPAESNLTVNACRWVILDTQINVLIDAKSKVSCVTEVSSEQLILLDLEPTLLQGGTRTLKAVCLTRQARAESQT